MNKEKNIAPSYEFEKGISLWKDAWIRLLKNRMAMWSLFFIIFVLILCFIIPFFPFVKDPNHISLNEKLLGISGNHWFGTDHLGRDLFARVLYGGQISLLVGLITTFVSGVVGIIYGVIAGYFGRWIDMVMMRIVDILYAIPFLVLVIIFSMFVDKYTDGLTDFFATLFNTNRSNVSPFTTLMPLFLAIGAFGWLTMARIVRSQVLSLKNSEFVEAARSLGLSFHRIFLRYLVPNTLGSVVVYATLTIPRVMLSEAMLSFLGLGVKPPNSSWGTLIKEGADRIESHLMLIILPGIMFSLTLLALNFLGDGLRDSIDPKSSKD